MYILCLFYLNRVDQTAVAASLLGKEKVPIGTPVRSDLVAISNVVPRCENLVSSKSSTDDLDPADGAVVFSSTAVRCRGGSELSVSEADVTSSLDMFWIIR